MNKRFLIVLVLLACKAQAAGALRAIPTMESGITRGVQLKDATGHIYTILTALETVWGDTNNPLQYTGSTAVVVKSPGIFKKEIFAASVNTNIVLRPTGNGSSRIDDPTHSFLPSMRLVSREVTLLGKSLAVTVIIAAGLAWKNRELLIKKARQQKEWLLAHNDALINFQA